MQPFIYIVCAANINLSNKISIKKYRTFKPVRSPPPPLNDLHSKNKNITFPQKKKKNTQHHHKMKSTQINREGIKKKEITREKKRQKKKNMKI